MKHELALLFATAVSAALMATGCAAVDDANEPLVIDQALLVETFEECAENIETCLDIAAVAADVEELVRQGYWVWPDDSAEAETDEFIAASHCTKRYYTSEGGYCTTKLKHKVEANRFCRSALNRPYSVVSYYDRGHCKGGKMRGLWFRCCG